jgi:hypothetical protein
LKKLFATLAIAATLVMGASISASATKPESHKVTICHAHPADSLTGPWVSISVDVASVGYQHSGHQDEHDGDIIPPYSYGDFSYEGKGDQSILANGCVAPEPPKEVFAPTATLLGPCGDPLYGLDLGNVESTIPVTFTATYKSVSHHVLFNAVKTYTLDPGETLYTYTKALRMHVKAGYPIVVTASAEGQTDLVLIDELSVRSRGVVCPWQSQG